MGLCVEIPAALAADLQSLTAALDRPGTDLNSLLHALAADTGRAVPSYLGLTMTLLVDDYPFTFTVTESAAEHQDIATSALLPLSAVCEAELGSVLVFYAAHPGAFVDFAADLSHSLGLSLDTIVLDQHLTPHLDGTGFSGLADLSATNQAIGLLIGHGFSPQDARGELHRLAEHAGASVRDIAQQLLRPPPQPERA